MNTTYAYKDNADRAVRIKEAEGKGLVMVTDHFAPDWKPGEEPHGVMTFTDEPQPRPSPDPWVVKWKQADTTTKKLDVIAEKLGLK